MIDRSPWFRVLAVGALLAAFVATARGGLRDGQSADAFAAACETDPPHDADGLERCLALHPRDIEVMLDLGSIYEDGGRTDHAEALYRRALSVDPKDGDVHVRLGRILLGRGDVQGAAREARTALGFQPGSSRALHLLERSDPRGDR